jgi:hypothetical protein
MVMEPAHKTWARAIIPPALGVLNLILILVYFTTWLRRGVVARTAAARPR